MIRDPEVSDAAVWEYAIECDSVRSSIVKWLDSPYQAGMTARQFIQSKGQHPHNSDLPEFRELYIAGSYVIPSQLLNLIIDIPLFPAHWLMFHNGIQYTPYRKKTVSVSLEGKSDKRGWFASGCCGYSMGIIWEGATAEMIEEDFGKWLKEEAKNHPEMRQRGRSSQVHTEKLRQLAAYRLAKNGVTYLRACAALQSLKDPHAKADAKRPRTILPLFENPSSWTEAKQAAELELERLAQGKSFP